MSDEELKLEILDHIRDEVGYVALGIQDMAEVIDALLKNYDVSKKSKIGILYCTSCRTQFPRGAKCKCTQVLRVPILIIEENLDVCPDCHNKSVRAKELNEGGGVECIHPGCNYWFCF